MSRALRWIAGMTIVAACADSGTEELTEADRQQLMAAFDSTASYIRTRNFAAWAAGFSEDGVLHAPNAAPMQGRSALIAWAESFPPLEEMSFSNVQVRGSDDLAYGTSDYSMKLQGLPADNGKQLVVFRRREGAGWEVAAVSFSSNLPLPVPDSAAVRKP